MEASGLGRPHDLADCDADENQGKKMTEQARRARRWWEAFMRAWRAGDAESAANLFADGCTFGSHPFRRLENPREFVRRVFKSDRNPRVGIGNSIIGGARSATEYWVTMVGDGRT